MTLVNKHCQTVEWVSGGRELSPASRDIGLLKTSEMADDWVTKMMLKRAMASALVLGLSVLGSKAIAAELLMIEEDGCFWCEAWNKDVSEIYPKTLEGKAAPLRRVDIRTDLEGEIDLQRSVHFTPTFLLIEDGKEVNRIEGYPGEDFFWGLLGRMLEEMNAKSDESVLNTSG